jgi:hypothetical protein
MGNDGSKSRVFLILTAPNRCCTLGKDNKITSITNSDLENKKTGIKDTTTVLLDHQSDKLVHFNFEYDELLTSFASRLKKSGLLCTHVNGRLKFDNTVPFNLKLAFWNFIQNKCQNTFLIPSSSSSSSSTSSSSGSQMSPSIPASSLSLSSAENNIKKSKNTNVNQASTSSSSSSPYSSPASSSSSSSYLSSEALNPSSISSLSSKNSSSAHESSSSLDSNASSLSSTISSSSTAASSPSFTESLKSFTPSVQKKLSYVKKTLSKYGLTPKLALGAGLSTAGILALYTLLKTRQSKKKKKLLQKISVWRARREAGGFQRSRRNFVRPKLSVDSHFGPVV